MADARHRRQRDDRETTERRQGRQGQRRLRRRRRCAETNEKALIKCTCRRSNNNNENGDRHKNKHSGSNLCSTVSYDCSSSDASSDCDALAAYARSAPLTRTSRRVASHRIALAKRNKKNVSNFSLSRINYWQQRTRN